MKIICSLFLWCFVLLANGSPSLLMEVSKLAKFEHLGATLGSLKTNVDFTAAPLTLDGSLRGSMVVVPYVNLTVATLERIMNPDRQVSGVLLLLPPLEGQHQDASATLEALSAPQQDVEMQQVQRFLLNQAWPMPIYFTRESSQLNRVMEAVSGGQTHELVFKHAEPRISPMIKGTNIEAWLSGSEPNGRTVVLVAHYDSFSPASGWAFGADANGSGAVALLELLRVFSQLYSSDDTRGRHNLMFVWTAAGRLDYAGAKQLIAEMGEQQRNQVDYVLCLDSLAHPTNGLYIHTSTKQSDYYDRFEQVANNLGMPLQIVHKAAARESKNATWEHEQFARKQLLAFTVSRLSSAALAGSHIFHAPALADAGKHHDSICSLYKNTRFVAEFVASTLYNNSPDSNDIGGLFVEDNVCDSSEDSSSSEPSLPHSLSASFLELWLSNLSASSRIFSSLVPDHPLIADIFETVQRYGDDVQLKQFELPKSSQTPSDSLRFFEPVTGSMSVYLVKPWAFDLSLLGGVVLYLLALFYLLKV